MNMTMKHRLQVQFVLISVVALILLQAFIVGFSIYRNYRQMTLTADRLILSIHSSQNSLEVDDARYFTVFIQPKNKNFEADVTHTSMVMYSEAMEYAKQVLSKSTDNGYLDQYRYLVYRGKKGIHITFLSLYAARKAFQKTAVTLILVATGWHVFLGCCHQRWFLHL